MKVEIKDIYEFKSITDLNSSINRRYVSFILQRADRISNAYKKDLWIFDTKIQKLRQLSFDIDISEYFWEDENKIVYTNATDKLAYICDVESLIIKSFDINVDISSLIKIDDEKYIGIKNTSLGDEYNTAVERSVYRTIDELPFWENGRGFINKIRKSVGIININEKDFIRISPESLNVDGMQVSQDKKKIIFWGTDYKDVRSVSNDVYIYDLESQNLILPVTEKGLLYSYANIISDGRLLTICTNMKTYGENEENKLFLLDIDSGEQTLIAQPELNMWNSIATDCKYGGSTLFRLINDSLYFISTKDYGTFLNRFTLDGKIEVLTETYGSVDGFAITDEAIYFTGLRGSKLQELYRLDGKKEVCITAFNNYQSHRIMSEPKKLSFKASDGTDIDGWVMKPIDFEDGKKYPAVLNIHGGPKMVYSEVYNHEMQCQCAQGYVVIYCNPRGSNGKGNEFSDLRGKFGTIDYDDIMDFVDTVLERYNYIDAKRLAVMGGSYGGYMTNWIVGHTNRFKTAVSQRSISNWITMFGLSDIGYHWTGYQTTATPWNNLDKLWECSPLKYADKVKTPVLFIHSDSDFRCPMQEGMQMFTALKYYDVKTKLCLFEGENHELSRMGKPLNREARLIEIMDWLEKTL